MGTHPDTGEPAMLRFLTDKVVLPPTAIEGVHFHRTADGYLYPVVAGGADGDAGGDDASGDAGGDDGADQVGDAKGDADSKGDDSKGDDPAAEAAKWKALSRQHERRAKENADAAAELARIKAENQTPSEKALNEAREAAKAEVRAEHAQALAGARLEAALTGIVDDPAEFVEDLNLAKFVTTDGEVDTAAIAAVREKYQKAATAKAGPGSADNGARDRDSKPARSSSVEGAVERKLSASA